MLVFEQHQAVTLRLVVHPELVELADEHLVVLFLHLEAEVELGVLLDDLLNIQIELLHLSVFHLELLLGLLELLHHVLDVVLAALHLLRHPHWRAGSMPRALEP